MVDFGWSASCLLEAIRLSNKIRKALQDAGGAKEEYEEAFAFLTQSDCIFKELEIHVRDDQESSYREAIVQQLKLMETPWRRLQISLSKYETSLGNKSSKSKLNILSRKVQWALKDLNDAVRKARVDVLGPLQMVNCLLQLHSMAALRCTNEKCLKLIDDLQAVDLPQTLQEGLRTTIIHHNEAQNFQVELKKWLTDIHDALVYQRNDLLDAIQTNTYHLEDRICAQPNLSISHSELSTTSANLLIADIFGEQQSSFEAINSALATQQARLDKLCDALQCVADSQESMSDGAVASLEIAAPKPITISALSAMYTVANMFILGCTTKLLATSSDMNETSVSFDNRFSHGLRQTHVDSPHSRCYSRSTTMREWPFQFADQTPSNSQPRLGCPTDGSIGQSIMRNSSMRIEQGSNNKTWYEWKCCHCGRGPWGGLTSSCWACSNHTMCPGCPRKTFEGISTSELAADSLLASSPASLSPRPAVKQFPATANRIPISEDLATYKSDPATLNSDKFINRQDEPVENKVIVMGSDRPPKIAGNSSFNAPGYPQTKQHNHKFVSARSDLEDVIQTDGSWVCEECGCPNSYVCCACGQCGASKL